MLPLKATNILQLCLCAASIFVFSNDAFAAGVPSDEINWLDFGLRVLNVAIFLGIIWFMAGKKIKGVLIGRGQKVVSDMEELEKKKQQAMSELAQLEKRIANVDEECTKILNEGRIVAENIAASIVEEAKKQADAIVVQAHKSAEQAIKSEVDAIRAKIADEIMAEVRKNLEQNIDSATHHKLIDSSIDRVSNF